MSKGLSIVVVALEIRLSLALLLLFCSWMWFGNQSDPVLALVRVNIELKRSSCKLSAREKLLFLQEMGFGNCSYFPVAP